MSVETVVILSKGNVYVLPLKRIVRNMSFQKACGPDNTSNLLSYQHV